MTTTEIRSNVGWEKMYNVATIISSSAISLVLFAGVGYLFRDFLATLFTSKIQSHYNEKLVKLESELQKSIASSTTVQNHLLSKINSMDHVAFERRAESLVGLWQVHCDLNKFKIYAELLKILDLEEFDKIVTQPNSQRFVATFTKDLVVEKMVPSQNGQRYQPFVPPLVWIYYWAYSSVVYHAIATWFAWKNQSPAGKFLKNENLIESVVIALPHQRTFLEKYGVSGVYSCLDELGRCLVNEIRKNVDTGNQDEESAKRALKMMKLSEISSDDPTQKIAVPAGIPLGTTPEPT